MLESLEAEVGYPEVSRLWDQAANRDETRPDMVWCVDCLATMAGRENEPLA